MKKLTFVLIVLCLALSAFSVSIDDVVFLEEGQMFALKQGAYLSGSSVTQNEVTSYVPALSMIFSTICSTEYSNSTFNVFETALIPYPQSWSSMSDNQKLLAVYNQLFKVSSLKGIKYGAGNDKKVLFDEAYTISDEKDKKSKTEDVQVSEIPIINNRFAYLKDNRFGGNVFSIECVNLDNEIMFCLSNQTSMKFLGITLLKQNQLSMYVDAYLTDEGIYLSAISKVSGQKPEVKILGKSVNVAASFATRMDALANWFKTSIEKTN